MEDETDGWAWPEFGEPELVERLLMPEADFRGLWINMVRKYPVREFTDEAFETGTGYPWPRPDGSYILEEGEGRLLAELDAARSEEVITAFCGPASGRTPMLAIGSNASPEGLWRKFAHFQDANDRTVLALSGTMRDFDVAATAELAMYGALPATLVPSPGTRTNAMLLWLTRRQLTQLAWAEIPYWIGRLRLTFDFEPALVGVAPEPPPAALVFVNRFGAFAPEGHPFGLAAVPAESRRYPALEQSGLLEVTAELVLGVGATPRDLVRGIFERPRETGPLVARTMERHAIPFESDRWTPFRGPG